MQNMQIISSTGRKKGQSGVHIKIYTDGPPVKSKQITTHGVSLDEIYSDIRFYLKFKMVNAKNKTLKEVLHGIRK